MVSTSPPPVPASQETVISESDIEEPLSQQSTASAHDAPLAPVIIPASPPLPPQKRTKFTSPTLLGSSLTPPPSTQVPAPPRRTLQRSSSGATSLLSSPPPTVKPTLAMESSSAAPTPTAEDINALPVAELRFLAKDLSASLREARTTAAHYKLQYNMLCLDSSEASNRMAVELAMVQREVDVLQQAEERRREESASPREDRKASAAATTALVEEISEQCVALRNENNELREFLGQSRRLAEGFEGRMLSLQEENERLRSRIKKNREHMNGLLETMKDRTIPTFSVPSTPARATPRNTARREQPHAHAHANRSGQPFEALLLADKMLSQETSTTTAPVRPGPAHRRASQSLSSLPSTPLRAPLLHTPPPHPSHRAIPQSAPGSTIPRPHAHRRRRRGSSDSTISAASDDERVLRASEDETDAIPESQASMIASSMLRRTPGSSFVHPSSFEPSNRGPASHGSSAPLVQAKLFGQVTKPHTEAGSGYPAKRKFYDSVHEAAEVAAARKRGKGEQVGLGIGLVGSRV